MNQGKYIFSQIVEFLPRYAFDKCVERYKGNNKVRKLSCNDQLLAMMFGQLTNLKSLRGIVLCLNAHSKQLYHLGFKARKFVLSTLTRANENRSWKIYRDLAYDLIARARKLYSKESFELNLDGTPYILDSTIIELCLSVFKWAHYKKYSAAIKLHTQLDLRSHIPSFFLITGAKVPDVYLLDIIPIEEKAYYIMDRGFIDFKRLYQINQKGAYFIVRAKKNLSFKRLYSRKVDRASGLRCDQIITLKSYSAKKDYPDKLRRVKYRDFETGQVYVYLTNNFELKAELIAELYKNRWQVELFFKWIKQHLHIQIFWGSSANAVKTQICIAICSFLLIAILKRQLKVDRNLHEILQILSVSQFEKTPVNTLLSEFEVQSFEHQTQQALFLLDP